MFFAGLCQVTDGLTQADSDGFTIITAAADSRLQEVHHRKPVVFRPEIASEWIDPNTTSERAQELMHRHAMMAESFGWYTVGRAVGKVENQGPSLIERAEHLTPSTSPFTPDVFG
jgi:putative SOS response-associated peptidase YedK